MEELVDGGQIRPGEEEQPRVEEVYVPVNEDDPVCCDYDGPSPSYVESPPPYSDSSGDEFEYNSDEYNEDEI